MNFSLCLSSCSSRPEDSQGFQFCTFTKPLHMFHLAGLPVLDTRFSAKLGGPLAWVKLGVSKRLFLDPAFAFVVVFH